MARHSRQRHIITGRFDQWSGPSVDPSTAHLQIITIHCIQIYISADNVIQCIQIYTPADNAMYTNPHAYNNNYGARSTIVLFRTETRLCRNNSCKQQLLRRARSNSCMLVLLMPCNCLRHLSRAITRPQTAPLAIINKAVRSLYSKCASHQIPRHQRRDMCRGFSHDYSD